MLLSSLCFNCCLLWEALWRMVLCQLEDTDSRTSAAHELCLKVAPHFYGFLFFLLKPCNLCLCLLVLTLGLQNTTPHTEYWCRWSGAGDDLCGTCFPIDCLLRLRATKKDSIHHPAVMSFYMQNSIQCAGTWNGLSVRETKIEQQSWLIMWLQCRHRRQEMRRMLAGGRELAGFSGLRQRSTQTGTFGSDFFAKPRGTWINKNFFFFFTPPRGDTD